MNFELEKIDNLELDYSDTSAVEIFAEQVEEAIKPYKVNCKEHGLAEVQKSKKFITKVKNKVSKYFKGKRDGINKIRTNILNAEKLANEPLKYLEEELKKDIKAEEERQEFELRKTKLSAKLALLEKYDLHLDEEVILGMTDTQFHEATDSMIKQAEFEKQREIETQKRIEEAKKQAAEEERKKIAEQYEHKEIVIPSSPPEEILTEPTEPKNLDPIEQAKKEVGYNDREFKIACKGNTVAIWKCVKIIKL